MSQSSIISREQALAEVKQIVAEHFAVAAEDLKEATHLVNDLGADSLDVVEVTMEVEEQFDITVPDEADKTALTLGEITDGVMQLLAAEG